MALSYQARPALRDRSVDWLLPQTTPGLIVLLPAGERKPGSKHPQQHHCSSRGPPTDPQSEPGLHIHELL